MTLLLVLGMALGLSGCKKKNQEVTYTLDTTGFNSVAVVGESLPLTGLKLIGSDGSAVMVGKDAVSGIDTSTAGTKSFTVTHGGKNFTVNYSVKFRVVFVVNGAEQEQLVFTAEEVVLPKTPEIAGKQFDRWSSQVPTVLTENLRIEALYKTLSDKREDVYTWTGNGVINLEGFTSAGADVSVSLTDKDGNPVSSATASYDKNTNKVFYALGSDNDVVVAISGTNVMAKSWLVSKAERPTLTVTGDTEATGVYVGADRSSHKISSNSKIPFKYSVSGNTNAGLEVRSGYLIVTPINAGVTEVTLTATNATNELEVITLTHYVVVMPEMLSIYNATYVEYGLEGIWTVGKDNADNLTKLSALYTNKDNIGIGFTDNLYFVTDDARVSVSKDGKITLNAADDTVATVNVRAVFGYKDVKIESAPMQVRCVFNGVNVYNYAELWAETQKAQPRPIVLQSSIKDFSTTNYNTMRSTYDLTYYKNIYGEGTPEYNAATMVKVLIRFTNDVYGNGYEINAHNATVGLLDSTGAPTAASLFRGPLNFVAMSDSGSSISVKGQDNIVFGVYEGVTLNNVILKSCDLVPNEDGKVDLTDLNFAGTTVEVLGDDVTIEYSRIMNGRTLLRVFGDANNSDKPVHVTVKNTLLKASREFNARIGSNRFEYSASEPNPNLPGDTGSAYNTKRTYDSLTAEEKAAYDSKFINTFVTFENVIFEDAGIFALAIDSHFAGGALQDGSGLANNMLVGWQNLARTSYGAKVTLKSDVRFYSWKPVDDIDSSTILENSFPDNNSLSALKLDVKTIVKKLKETVNSNIIYTKDGKDYAHAAIVFFGGGKNYGVVENAITSDFNPVLHRYDITLRDIGQQIYEIAAGSQPFYLLMCDNTSNFTYEIQTGMPADEKYAPLRK